MSAWSSRRRNRRLFPSSFRHGLVFIAFLAMLMGPTIASSVTLAQDDLATEEAPQELLPVEETVEPMATEPLEPEPATLTITKGVCDTPGFDPYMATTEQELADNCTAPPINAEFTVSDGLGFSSTQSGTQVVFDIPADTPLTISETVPDGYGEPVASCVSEVLGSAGLISVTGGAATVTIDLGDDFSCTWYNVPVPTDAELTINKYRCPEGYDVADPASVPLNNCTEPMDGVTFTVADEDPSTADLQSDTGDSIPGAVLFGGLLAGDYTVAETLPDGIASAFIWNCDVEGGRNEIRETPLSLDTELNLRLTAGMDVTCNWFNVPGEGEDLVPVTEPAEGTEPADGADNSITVYKWDCPAGTEYGMDEAYYSAECDTQHLDIPFSLVDANGTHEKTTQSDGTQWDGVEVGQEGELQLVEEIPDGYGDPVVYCWSSITDPEPMSSTNGFVVPQPVGGDGTWDYFCNWYNIPSRDGGSVHIVKYTCPAGVEYSEDDYALSEACQEDVDPVEFTVSNESGYTESQFAAAGAPQNAEFTDVPYGTIILIETVPEGYGAPLAFCSDTPADGAGNYEPVTVEGGTTVTWGHSAEAEGDLTCIFFNFPTGDGGDVTFTKYYCGEDVDGGADWPVLAEQCTDSGPAVDLTLTVPTAGHQESASTGDEAPQGAVFSDVPYGQLFIEESVPDGYGWPRVFCTDVLSDGMGDFEELIAGAESEAGAFTWDHDAEAAPLRCIVFNFPGRDTTVVIHKWFCPEGAGGDDLSWYEGNCTETREGSEFQLYHEDGWSLGYTDGSGTVQWDNVPTGPIAIQEYLPPEYGTPFVVCNVNGGEWNFYPAETGYIEHPEFGQSGDQGDHVFTCHWYNIPGGPSDITIFKYTCPAGYDLYAEGANPEADCPEATNGIAFTLSGAATERYTETGENQNPNGGAYFADLQPGSYTITETVPADTAYVFVLDCYGQNQGELRPYPLSIGDTLHIDVSAGEYIACHWYNVPEDPDGRLTVVKHTCSTKVYVSDVDCEIYEDGQDFDLVMWDGDSWEYAASGTTDGVGRLGWTGLEPGEYWIDEQDGEWCHMTSDWLSDDGNWLNVNANEETIVQVYNCTGEPGKPGGTPTKYPNTGGAPIREEWRLEP